MSSLTRRVLAHKRVVGLTWVFFTLAGIAASGPASDALEQRFSVPDKEGWETSVARGALAPVVSKDTQTNRGTGGNRRRWGRTRCRADP